MGTGTEFNAPFEHSHKRANGLLTGFADTAGEQIHLIIVQNVMDSQAPILAAPSNSPVENNIVSFGVTRISTTSLPMD